jgi:hypothetical protein
MPLCALTIVAATGAIACVSNEILCASGDSRIVTDGSPGVVSACGAVLPIERAKPTAAHAAPAT